MFAAVGFIGAGMVLSSRIRSRRDAVRSDLPDALDMLAVSVEAGLGFDGAITKLTEHMEDRSSTSSGSRSPRSGSASRARPR